MIAAKTNTPRFCEPTVYPHPARSTRAAKVLVFLLTLGFVWGTAFAQEQEKVGIKITTEFSTGDLGNPDFAKPFTSGVGKDADFIAGSATWVLPKLEYSKTVRKWTVDAVGGLEITSSGEDKINAPKYGIISATSLKLTYQITDAAKVWAQAGDGSVLKPGFSYAFGPVTAQLEIPLASGLFTKPVVRIEPKVSYAANGIGASLKGVLAVADITEADKTISGDGEDWNTFKQAEKTSVLQGLEFAASYTGGPIKAEITAYFPLYANWTLNPDDEDDLGVLGGQETIVGKNTLSPVISGKGITIEPKFTYTISAFALYAKVKIGNIGLSGDLIDQLDTTLDKKLGVSIVPTVGVTYAF